MSLETKSFEFGEFRLDSREKVLLRDGEPVAITPKAFLLLHTLVKNHGHIVEKEQLMKVVWADSFVEDGNLTFTINLLRKVLGDHKRHSVYIETVSRRGYRFIAPVKEHTNGNGHRDGAPQSQSVEPAVSLDRTASRSKFGQILIPIALISIILIGYAAIRSRSASGIELSAPILLAPLKTERLSTDGTVHHAVISSDGKNVVYTNRSRGRQSVWLRQLATSSNTEIISPSDDFYGGLSLSPDGRFLYFTRTARGTEGQLDIFMVSIFGGIPTRIISETQGWIDVSKDGKKISFVRCYYRDDEYCSLWIANAEDGTGETMLAARPAPIRIGENRISPDGKTVAFAVGQSENQSNEFSLMAVDIESRVERKLTAEMFFNIKGIAWLPNLTDILFTASKIPDMRYRIWQASTASGRAVPLTTDSENYATLSLDSEAKMLVSTRVDQDFRLNLYQTEDPSRPPQILADASAIDFASNGRIAFSSVASGNNEIWSIGTDGGERRQLTNNDADDTTPVFSPDGNLVYFSSNRSGETQIWRMNADGSLQTQINTEEGGFPNFVSPDGAWLYYLSARQRSLRRVSTDGGRDELVLNIKLKRVAVSPDGSRAAYSEKIGDKRDLVVISIPEAQTIARYTVADEKTRLVGLEWSADGKVLAYILGDPDLEKNSLWFLPLATGTPTRFAELGPGELAEQAGFTLSPDGRRFAVGMGGWRHDAVLFTGLR